MILLNMIDLPFHLWDLEGQIYPSLLAFPEDLEDQHHQSHQVVQDCPIVKIMPFITGIFIWDSFRPCVYG